MNQEERHTISILVDNEPGVLSRVAGLFSGRGFNIVSLNVAETLESGLSRITLVSYGVAQIQEQINKQLRKLVNVVKVTDFSDSDCVEREMALVKVQSDAAHRAEVLRIADIFRCKVVDVSPNDYTIEVTGNRGKIEALIDLLRPVGSLEIARTGVIAMARSKKGIKK